jgi:hypothetical protein
MNRYDEYRQKAEEAKRQADRSTREPDREAWLWLARDWMALVKEPRGNDHQEK